MKRFAALIATVALAACSAGTNTGVLPSASTIPELGHTTGSAHHAKGRLRFAIHIPKARKRAHHKRKYAPDYVSPATQSMSVAITGPTNVSEAVGLTPTSSGCSSSLTGTFCTLTIGGLAPGNYTASISTYDGPISGSAPTGNLLSKAQNVGFTIVAGQNNSIGITLGGIPAAVVLVPDANSTLSGSMSAGYTLSKCGSDKVSVIGVDADDNYILGAGAPTPALSSDSATLTVATPAPSSPNAFTITRPTTDLPAPGSTVQLTASVTPAADSGGSTITSSPIAMTFNSALCGVITEYTVTSQYSSPSGIAAGPDGALWFTDGNGNVGRITTAGSITEYTIPTSSGLEDPSGIAAGPDGALWFTALQSSNIDLAIARMTTAGVITNSYPTTGQPESSTIVTGPDNNLWFTDQDTLGKVTTGGTITLYTVPTSSANLSNVTVGPDGNLWFTECNGNKIGRSTTTGTLAEFPTGAHYPSGITSAGGALWFANYNGISKITTSGTTTLYQQSGNGAHYPLVTAPDGTLWYAGCGTGLIEHMTTAGTNLGEYPVANNPDIPSNGMTFGPDGSLWFTVPPPPFGSGGNGAIGRLQ
jgi:virginiamycin B lyase